MTPKKILFVNRRPAYAGVHGEETLEAALIAAAFGQQVHLAFLDDGVYQVMKDQDPAGLGRKSLGQALSEVGEQDIDHVWVERESLAERGIAEDRLVPPATVVDRPAMARLMAEMDIILGA